MQTHTWYALATVQAMLLEVQNYQFSCMPAESSDPSGMAQAHLTDSEGDDLDDHHAQRLAGVLKCRPSLRQPACEEKLPVRQAAVAM